MLLDMATTIRIDEDVYACLQRNARPFEETPNSLLIRIAGLEPAEQEKISEQKGRAKEPMKRHRLSRETPRIVRVARVPSRGRMGLNGKQLNDEWKVNARHALFSRTGGWYENLASFPGALFDPHGYILF